MRRALTLALILFAGCPEEPHGPRSTPPPVPVDAGPHPPRPAKEAPTALDIGPDDAANRAVHVAAVLDLATGRTEASKLPEETSWPVWDDLGTIGLGALSGEEGEPEPVSDEPPPAGFATRLDRRARVSAVTGSPPVSVGAACTVAVTPVRDWESNCRVVVRCGATTIYGAETTGYAACFVDGGAPARAYDRKGTYENGDPTLFLDVPHDRAVLSDRIDDREWSVTLALVR